MKTKILIIVISLVSIATLVFSRTADALTMEEALATAMESNPTLSAAAHAADAAHARPSQAATPPDLNFMVQFGKVPINTIDVGQGTITYMVQQMVPFPAKLVYGYRAEKRAAQAMDSRREMTAQELKRMVKLAYLEAYRLQEEKRIESEARRALGISKASAEAAYAANEGTLSDPLRAAVDIGDIDGRLATIEQDRLDALANLSALMARPLDPDTRVSPPKKLPSIASLDTLDSRAKTVQPDIKETEHLIQTQSARVSLAKAQYGPDLTLRWGYDDQPNMQDAWTGRVMISVPIWSATKQRFGVRESKAMLKRAESMNEERILSTEAAVKSAYAQYRAATKRTGIYANNVVPRAKTYLRATKEGYQSGDEDFSDVTDAVLALRKAEVDLIRARVDQQRAYADLERAVGSSPTKEGL